MRISLPTFWHLLKESYKKWNSDEGPRLAAALSYYTAFSIAPLLVIAIGAAGLIFGAEAVQGKVSTELSGVLGSEAARFINDMVKNSTGSNGGGWATVIGGVVLLFGASGVFAELQGALNIIWKAAPERGSGIWNFIRRRLLSFGMVLALGFLLLVSLMLSTMLAVLAKYVGSFGLEEDILLRVAETVVSFLLMTMLFAAIYKVLPDVDLTWRDVTIGAGFTAALITLGKFLIGLYLGQSATASSFGAAGALVVLLLWVYYAAHILYLGAEFTYIFATNHGTQQDRPAALAAAADQNVPKPPGAQAKAEAITPSGAPAETNVSHAR